LVQAVAGEQVAPVWAQELIQNVAVLTQNVAVLTQNVAVLTQNVAVLTQNNDVLAQNNETLNINVAKLLKRTSAAEIKRKNGYVVPNGRNPDEVLFTPPPNDMDEAPDNFPRTIPDFATLTAGNRLSAIEKFYGLSHIGSITARIHSLAKEYGIQSTLL
jgi:cell division protein FtsB